MHTVRVATFDVLRHTGMTTIFSNPGSTEVSFLTDLPDDLEFVLALHEGSVVGIATGHALATGSPALVVLHTTAGLGNAVGALATARVNRAPLVVVVGQQDRRHLALEPFLAGRLSQLAGDYPVWVDQPVRAQDVPGAIQRAFREATIGRGPALVIVPMDDWLMPAGDTENAASDHLVIGRRSSPESVTAIAELIDESRSPARGRNGSRQRRRMARLDRSRGTAELSGLPGAFGARAGFPQDHRLFVGTFRRRAGLRRTLEPFDLVIVIGAPVFRQYPFDEGPLVPSTTSVVVITDIDAEASRSPARLAVLADPAAFADDLSKSIRSRPEGTVVQQHPIKTPPTEPGSALRAAHVLGSLSRRLPPDAVLVEETPSSRSDLHELLPARAPLGFVSAAMGGLGFAMPAAIGLKMGARIVRSCV